MRLKFYMPDDIKHDFEQAKKDPNARYAGRWCDAISVDDEARGDCERCPLCNAPVSMLKWLEPRRMRLTNPKYPDRLTAWLSEPMVVSEKVKEAYEQEGLTGVREFVPVEVVKVSRMTKRSTKPPKYFSAEIGFAANVRLDIAKSKIVGQKHDGSCELCDPWGKTRDKIVKLALNASEWKGEDVFKVFSLSARIIVSQRFHDFVERHCFTNFNLVPVEDYRAWM